ncbi:MAG: hypothetical protein M1819_001650 [Sarea resinae]|nr:MAG: hypothetical protein M1819_001650 [Sarea resinae]
MAADKQALQVFVVPHRPARDAEIEENLAGPLKILFSAPGLLKVWKGFKHEETYTKVYLLLWKDLAASHAFYTSPDYFTFTTDVQPALNGRKIIWKQHALVDVGPMSSPKHLESIVNSPALEVAWTEVVEGKVARYYSQFGKVVAPLLDGEPGCNGFFISPQIEDPQAQVLLINWDSVDAHHVDFEHRPSFKNCIDALFDCYAVFVVPWHIMGLHQVK